MLVKAVKGVKDILPEAIANWRGVEKQARGIFARFGFNEIVLPIFEKSELFIKGVGELTDIVQKEMYTFTDRGGENLTLRPEGTAGCVRAYVEHSMYHPPGAIKKLFYFGPMFRRERPQAGRFRQFYQIGAELFGADQPTADAEIIQLLHLFVTTVGVKKPRLSLNSLGCDLCRPPFKKTLLAFLEGKKAQLCGDCEKRYEKNPLRVFDCKNETCKKIVANAPTIDACYCHDCEQHFAKLQNLLNALGVPFKIDPKMVRGLDYYSRTVFEITAGGKLGAKNEVAGGGRYDGLVKKSGGPDIPAIGFALGMERLIDSIGDDTDYTPDAPDVYMVSMGDSATSEAFLLAGRLREKGIKVESPYKPGGMKNQMGKAGKSGAKLAIIMGDDELAKGVAIIKNLVGGGQEECRIENLSASIKSLLT